MKKSLLSLSVAVLFAVAVSAQAKFVWEQIDEAPPEPGHSLKSFYTEVGDWTCIAVASTVPAMDVVSLDAFRRGKHDPMSSLTVVIDGKVRGSDPGVFKRQCAAAIPDLPVAVVKAAHGYLDK